MSKYLNTKTLGGAAIALIALVLLFPPAIAYLPYLILLACPLMMVFMHGGGGHAGHEMSSGTDNEADEYVCPMHSEIRSTFPGRCPKCGMELKPVFAASAKLN